MRAGLRVKRALGRAGLTVAIAGAFALIAPAGALAGHFLLDHPAAPFGAGTPPPGGFQSGGEGAKWELIETISTGNPHTDLDFFTQGANTYASVGTLGIGPNAGGQTIVKLAEGGEVTPETIGYVAAHPSASCLSNPAAATALQHDVEASPKGSAILNTPNPAAVVSDTQLLIDASDAEGRCHDQGVLGIEEAPQGGLEIVDVTDVANPVEIGLTSHIGESHTVNVDPKRPQIAYSVTSDAVEIEEDEDDVDGDGDTTELIRDNENPTDADQTGRVGPNPDRFDLDGFEVVDFSSCMDFPAGATLESKRSACKPEVYRYRYPTAEVALGHTLKEGANGIFGCHELEVYPDDTLTCGAGNALIELDMSGAFDDMGTPTDFSDDKPRGTPLPCKLRASSTLGATSTGAMVTDCVDGTNDDADVGGVTGAQDLTIPGWIAQGAPSLEGVEYKGSIYHQGRGAGTGPASAFDSTEDIDFNHESELTGSGEHLLATDERGGGVLPPGASCTPAGDNPLGNGGVHFYDRDGLSTAPAPEPEEAFKAYARTPEGEKAIFRAKIRTQPKATVCTAHVLQQIPGENRIFMGWYSQGTQVVDFVENADGTITLAEAGYFIPANANEWVSHVFKTEQNPDGTTTYYGATGDFNLAEAGRNSIDVYKVTLPPAPKVVAPGSGGGGPGGGPGAGDCTLEGGGAKITGTAEGEKLFGSIASDRISGRQGNDKIKGREGNDCLKGNGGKDRLKGGSENDTLRGGGGRDQLKGNGGRDLLGGGSGADRLNGNGGGDKITDRSGGKDRLFGGGGRDTLKSNKGGSDKVDCGPGRDKAIVDDADRTRSCEQVKVRG